MRVLYLTTIFADAVFGYFQLLVGFHITFITNL